VQIKKVSPWMERMADLMIARPGITLSELSAEMNKVVSWISIVRNSDTFQDYWKERSKSHSDAVTLTMKDRAFAAADLSLEFIHQKLEKDGSVMPISAHLDVIETTMKRFGYGGDSGKPGAAPQINFNFAGLASPEQLRIARERMRTQLPEIEGESLPAQDSLSGPGDLQSEEAVAPLTSSPSPPGLLDASSVDEMYPVKKW
jgi:hypothetical protein